VLLLTSHRSPAAASTGLYLLPLRSLNLNGHVLMALPAWRQALALALRASDGDVSGCSLPPRATATCTQRERDRTSFAFNHPSRRSIMGHAVHSGSAAAHSRPGPPRAHRRVQVGAPHRRNRIYNALFNTCNSRRGFMDDGHLTFVTDVRSSKASISRICSSTTVLFYVAPNAGAGGRAAEEQRR
jgi:hypothetical protein